MATILCIDDEPSPLQVRKLLLESEGHRVVGASSGQEGLRLLALENFNLVILDYWMSGMNGMDVARQIKAMRPGVPIIMLSGFGELPGEAIGLAERWILKGSATKELLKAISDLT